MALFVVKSPAASGPIVTAGPAACRLKAAPHTPSVVGGHSGHGLLNQCTATITVAVAAAALRATRRSARSSRGRVVLAATDVDSVKAALAAKEAEYRKRQDAARGAGPGVAIPALADVPRVTFVGEDGLLGVPEVPKGVRASTYAIFAPDGALQYIGISRSSQTSLRAHFARRPELCGSFAVFDVMKPDRKLLEAAKQAWASESGGSPPGNDGGAEQRLWEEALNVKEDMTTEQKEEFSRLPAAAADAFLREVVLEAEIKQVEAFEAVGCNEQLLFDAKMKAKGMLDLDAGAPIGVVRPEGGVGATFKVVLKTADGEDVEIECPADMTILDAAENADVELPSSCKSGACSACAGKVLAGTIDQSDQGYLDEEQVAEGYCLTCVTYPRSDITVQTNLQADVA